MSTVQVLRTDQSWIAKDTRRLWRACLCSHHADAGLVFGTVAQTGPVRRGIAEPLCRTPDPGRP